MSELVLIAGQLLSVLTIVGGLGLAFWQVWVLAGKLARLPLDETSARREQAHGPGAPRHEQRAPPNRDRRAE